MANNLFRTLKEIRFIHQLDRSLKLFCYYIRKDLREEKDHVIAVTGYPGVGKSQCAAIISCLVDRKYAFHKNICFIPTSSEIERRYMGLSIFSVLHIDEASRGLHKQKWYDAVQQKLNLLYDTEREGHFLCTFVVMPRFQNFTENFRNFRIKYWINIVERGLAIVYKRDEDKDCRDPWHIDENYKKKSKMREFRTNVYQRNMPDIVRTERKCPNFLFYFRIPEIPRDIWAEYKHLKKTSRDELTIESEREIETPQQKKDRERKELLQKIKELKEKGYTDTELAATLSVTLSRLKTLLKEVEVLNIKERLLLKSGNINADRNIVSRSKNISIPEEFDKV